MAAAMNDSGRRLLLVVLIECEGLLRKLVGSVTCASTRVAALRSICRGQIHSRALGTVFPFPIRGLAPMVGASELCFRLTTRALDGANVCWTPMIDAGGYARSESYRSEFPFDSRDSPCIAQLGGRGCEDMYTSARLLALRHNSVVGVELNVGCPQRCAKQGRYGAFLLAEPDLLESLIGAIAAGIAASGRRDCFPAAKIRSFPGNRSKTVSLARRLVLAGARILTIHGRGRTQTYRDKADWEVVRLVKQQIDSSQALVLANGDVSNLADFRLCLSYTNADGAMSARGLLRNPACLSRKRAGTTSLECALLYLSYARRLGETDENSAVPHPAAVRRHLSEILERELRAAPPECRKTIMAFRGAHIEELSRNIERVLAHCAN